MLHTTLQSNPSTLADAELVALFLEGNSYSLYILLFERHKQKLKKVLGNVLSNYDDYDLEDWLDGFFHDLTLPRGNGKNRLAGYKPEQSFEYYISTILRNWAIDKCRQEAREKELFERMPDYGESVLGDDSDDGPAGSPVDVPLDEGYSEWELNASMVLALECLRKLPPKSRYIVLTYLLCECYKSKVATLGFDRRMARLLGMSEQAVRTSRCRSMEKLRDEAKKYRKAGVTFE